MSNNRSVAYKKYWDDLSAMYGNLCFYCRKEIATCIDHVVPYSWDGDNSINNLVLCCSLCNQIASDKMFDSVIQKQAYILKHREKYKNVRAICTECLLPYAYKQHSPSLFLCAECYDMEYGTIYSFAPHWKRWLVELSQAGIMAGAHRLARKTVGACSSRERRGSFMATLIDEYANAINSDLSFFEKLAI